MIHFKGQSRNLRNSSSQGSLVYLFCVHGGRPVLDFLGFWIGTKFPTNGFCAAVAVMLGVFANTIARAGESSSCHFHGDKPANEETVKRCAVSRLEKLVQSKKIGSEWVAITPDLISLEVVEGKKGKEWKASINNPKNPADTKTKTLFLFFTHQGNFIAANFTGK